MEHHLVSLTTPPYVHLHTPVTQDLCVFYHKVYTYTYRDLNRDNVMGSIYFNF